MPEGDTIHRTAGRLAAALDGRVVTHFRAPRVVGPVPEPGETVTGVEARGKHLLVRFSGGLVLHTHMRMSGSWHLYRPGERWRRADHLARAVIGVDGWEAVCFSAPFVRLTREPALDHLGPDLCRPGADLDAVVDRVPDGAAEIGVVLLDQQVAAGIGNVFKSEVLWACRVDPFAPVGSLDRDALLDLYRVASRQLRDNLGPGPRTTVPGGLAVYGRTGRRCRRCGHAIRARPQGPDRRVTFWCPACQASPTVATPSPS